MQKKRSHIDDMVCNISLIKQFILKGIHEIS